VEAKPWSAQACLRLQGGSKLPHAKGFASVMNTFDLFTRHYAACNHKTNGLLQHIIPFDSTGKNETAKIKTRG
jgi:hypothetical protein